MKSVLCSVLVASSAMAISASTLENVEEHFMQAANEIIERANFNQNSVDRPKPAAAVIGNIAQNNARTKSDRVIRAASSQQYITYRMYNSTENCDGNTLLQGTYGIDICVAASTWKYPTAQSTQYQYDDNMVTQDFYASTDCSGDVVASRVAANFTGYDQDSCSDSPSGFKVEWSETGSFSAPNQDGTLIGEYASSSCSDPYMAAWGANGMLDGMTFGFDDLELTKLATCTQETVSGDDLYYYYSDDSFAYNTTGYFQFETTQQEDSSSHKNKCFLGSETVEMASGEIVPISSIKVGDSIVAADRSGKSVISEVIAIPHGSNTQSAVFINLLTSSGKDLSLTPDHLLMVNTACNAAAETTDLRPARDVAPGMCLMSTSSLEVVSSVSEFTGRGIYTLVTKDEMLVVNGFVASPFAGNHAVLNAYYNVIRAVPALMQLPLLKQANMIFGSLVEAFTY